MPCARLPSAGLTKRRSVFGYLVKNTGLRGETLVGAFAFIRRVAPPRALIAIAAAAGLLALAAPAAQAMKIERVVTPGGVHGEFVNFHKTKRRGRCL